MDTLIYLIRHGVTDWNYAGRVQGRSDIPLAPEGERQAEAAAERLAGEPCDAIYSSPLRRAYQTAQIISRRIGHRHVITDSRLVERDMGEAEGMLDVDLPRLWPGVPWNRIPGMEPVERLAARAHDALREIAARHPGGRVICVTHGGLISTFLRSLVPPNVRPQMDTHPRNASITIVRCGYEGFVQVSLPDHRHILQDGIEYSGEKGRVSGVELEGLLADRLPRSHPWEQLIWGASAIESARVGDKLVGFARAFTDGVLYGCIDIAVVLPGYEHVRPVLIDRLKTRYRDVQFTVLSH
jgi:broad specificity phosphatase PhoE